MTVTQAAAVDEARRRALAALDFARSTTRKLLHDFPDDRATHQLITGDVHAMWIVGHLAVSDEWIQGMIDPSESQLPKGFKELFGHNSTAVADRDAYPPFGDLRERFEATRTRLINAVNSAKDDQLVRTLGEEGVGFASDPLDAVAKIAWHEGWHAGQVSRIRRALGLPHIFRSKDV